MKRAKKYTHKGRTINRLPNGRHQIWIKGSDGKPYRPSYATLEEARAKLDEFLAQEARGERFLSSAAHYTLSEALDWRHEALIHKGRDKQTINRHDSNARTLKKTDFANWKLIVFFDDRMERVKKWLTERKDGGDATQTLDHFRSVMRGAFQAAIEKGKMAPPNPIVAFGVTSPQVRKEKRKPFTIDDMTAFMRGATIRQGKGGGTEQGLASEMRLVASVLGLEMPWRDQDICGLCWECVNLDQRIMFIRRVVKKIDRGDGRDLWSLEEDTKTGEEGFRELYIPPMSHAVLSAWRDRLQGLGLPTTGVVPMLRTQRVSMITPHMLASNHIATIMTKAKLLKEDGGLKYTWYNLRHTVPSMWGAIGVAIDDIQDWMRHEDYNTTKKIYKHRVQEYVTVFRPAVEDVIETLGLERTAHGLVDALSIALVRMFRDAGIDLPCSQPIHLRQKRLPNYHHHNEPRAIDGPVIDAVPTMVTMEVPPPVAQLVLPRERLTELRRAEAKRLSAPPHNWTRKRIATHLGICTSTLSQWLNNPHEVPWMRKKSLADRAGLEKRIAQMHDGGGTSPAIARALAIPVTYVRAAERRRGRPFGAEPRKMRSWKLEPHEPRIREMIAEGKPDQAIARELGLGTSTVNAFIVRRGLRQIRWGKIGPHEEARILEGIAAGKSGYAIARELGLKRSTVGSLIKRHASQDPIKPAEMDSKESAGYSAAQIGGESSETGAHGQTQSNHCTKTAQIDLFDAAD